MLTPETVISIKVVTCTLSLVCIIARYFIARQASGGIMSLRSSFSHFTLLVASLCDFSATGLSACALVAEIGYRKSGLSGSGLDDVLLLPKNSRMFFFTNLTYFLAICLIKAAYLLFYAELCAKGAHTLQQHTLWAATLIWATTNVAGLFIVFFWCNPVTDNWTGGSSNRCPAYLSTGPILIQGILNIISDLAILAVPILLVSSLKVSNIEKRALFIIFAIGSISIASSLIRTIWLTILVENPEKRLTWNTIHVYMLWSHAEVFFGVLAFTLPGFRFLLRRWFGASVSQPATGASKATTDIDTYNSKCFQQLLSQESLPPFSMGMECYRPTENLSTTLSIEDEGSFVGNGLKPTPPRKNS